MIYRLFLLLFLTVITTKINAQESFKPSAPIKTNTQERIEIPFEVYKGIIYVQAVLNGESGTFILDSGAGDLILNSDVEKLKYKPDESIAGGGVGGKEKKAGYVHIKSFNWYGINLSEGDVSSSSMTHLGKKNTLGLIGYRVFNDYALTFDYTKFKIVGTLKTSLAQEKETNGKLLATIPFEMYEHVPVFRIEINGKFYNMGLDCGAAGNLIYEKYVPELQGSIIDFTDTNLVGIGGKVRAKKGRIKKLKADHVVYKKLRFAFENDTLDDLNIHSPMKIDGLLGYEFLKKYITTIDFKAKEIRIYKS